MATWHGYFATENLALSGANRDTLIDELKGLGVDNNSPQPARRQRWRARLDNEAVIFEAAFDEDNLTVAKFKQRLGVIFGVSPVTIGSSTANPTFDTLPTPVVTFSRTGTDYIRVALFGGIGATWDESRREAKAFIAANAVDWITGS